MTTDDEESAAIQNAVAKFFLVADDHDALVREVTVFLQRAVETLDYVYVGRLIQEIVEGLWTDLLRTHPNREQIIQGMQTLSDEYDLRTMDDRLEDL